MNLNIESAITTANSTDYPINDSGFLTSVLAGSSSITIPAYNYDGNGVYKKIKGLLSPANIKPYSEVVITNGVNNTGFSSFSKNTNLTKITLPNSIVSLGQSFQNCTNLSEINLPNWLTSINNQLFFGCSSLTSITIPEGITQINFYTFSGCSNLTSVTIPIGVTSIFNMAFGNCTSLTSITYKGTMAQWNSISLTVTDSSSWDKDNGNYTIHCTDGDIAKS